MESTNTKMEGLKPFLFKAGTSLVISVASFIIAKMVIIKKHKKPLQNLENDELSSMRIKIKEMQEKVLEREMKIIHYQDLKEREVMIMELQNKLLMEITSIEIMEREVSSMEAEGQRIENMVVDYMKVMEFLQLSRSENELIIMKVMKILKDKDLEIEGKEMVILKNVEEIGKMEDEMKEMKMAIEMLESEKHELLTKIDLAKNAASFKIDGEAISIEDHNKLRNELEQLQNDRAAERKELIFLRWSHACLRHELMRRNQEQVQEKEMELQNNNNNINNNQHIVELHYGSDNEVNSNSSLGGGQYGNNSCLGFSAIGHVQHHRGSRRKKLVEKLKKWVDHHHGSDDDDDRKSEKSSDGKAKHEH